VGSPLLHGWGDVDGDGLGEGCGTVGELLAGERVGCEVVDHGGYDAGSYLSPNPCPRRVSLPALLLLPWRGRRLFVSARMARA
jgi:hypothetical protein